MPHSLPRLGGRLVSVSADRIVDDKTDDAHYEARISIDAEQLKSLDGRIKLLPGMPAQLLIVTDHRTMAGYLFEPFLRVLRKSFREV